MRLTLRRLLSYLDGILDEQDAEALAQKIEESEFASRLVHRIRSAKGRLRLGAPRLAGKGMGLDPNTVAEYLDYTLTEERVTEFEKVCLESDVHLAEVASAHEILSLVLAEPARVERRIRDRIYALPEEGRRPASAEEGQDGVAHGEPSPPPVADEARQEATAMREMSQYLDKSSQGVRLRPILVTVAVSFLLVLVALRAMGPFNSKHPVVGRLIGEVPPPAAPLPPADPGADPAPLDAPPVTIPSLRSDDVDQTGDQPADQTGDQPVDSDSVPSDNTLTPEASTPDAPTGDAPTDAPTTEPDAATPDAEEAPADSTPDTRPGAGPELAAPVLPPSPAPADAGGAGADQPSPAAADIAAAPVPVPPPTDPTPGTRAAADTASAETTPADASSAAADVGRYISQDTVLARFDESQNDWFRVPPRTVMRAGDRLLVLPAFRPQIALASGVQLLLVGPAQLRLLAPREGMPSLEVDYGRMVIDTLEPGAGVHVRFAGQEGTAIFDNIDSALAIEVSRFLPVGADPETAESQSAIRWTVTGGQVRWRDAAGVETLLRDGESMTAVGDQTQAPSAAPRPDWIDPRSLQGIDQIDHRQATEGMALRLSADQADRPLSLTLQELVSHRRVDHRSLAVRSLIWIGVYEPFISTLRDEDLRSYWSAHYDTIRAALAQGPDVARAVQAAFQRERPLGQDAARLYRLTWSFNNEQLQAGEAAALVENLANESMDIRVLAAESLRRIVDKAHLYRPEKAPEQQRAQIQDWRKALSDGSILWKQEPGPFPRPSP